MTAAAVRVYLDHNATSPARPEAVEAVRRALESCVANPSSLHAEGRAARALVESARERVASLIGASPSEVVFTSGGSEAIATAIGGVSARARGRRRRILAGVTEHSAVLEAARRAEEWGCPLSLVPCAPDGRIDPVDVEAALDDDVLLVAVQWANNETGVVQPVDRIGRACSEAGALFLVDAVQAVGKIPIEARRANADLLAASAHKIGGPQGVGALAVRDGVDLLPLVPGGAQERRRRGGTESVAAIAGFGAAADAAARTRPTEAARLLRLRTRIEARLRDAFPDLRVHGAGAPRLPNTVNFAVPGIAGETLAVALDVEGFAVSTGSACASGAVEPSHVLEAMGLPRDAAREGVRVSLGWSTTDDEVDRFLDALPRVACRIREVVR